MRIKVKNSGIVKLAVRKDSRRGDLFIAESKKNIPFPIRRVYFLDKVKDASVVRGGHAHKKTMQAIFCANGSFVLRLDDGRHKQKVVMNKSGLGVILGPKLWHSMSNFSKDCVMLVFASDYYKERDYIREYKDFLASIKKHL